MCLLCLLLELLLYSVDYLRVGKSSYSLLNKPGRLRHIVCPDKFESLLVPFQRRFHGVYVGTNLGAYVRPDEEVNERTHSCFYSFQQKVIFVLVE